MVRLRRLWPHCIIQCTRRRIDSHPCPRLVDGWHTGPGNDNRRNQNTDGAGNTTFTFAESEILPQIGAASSYWRLVGAATAPPGIPIFRAAAGSNATVRSSDLIHITPAQSSNGSTFFYKPPLRSLTISGSVRTAVMAPDPDQPVGNASVMIVVRNGSGATLDQRSVATDASGTYSYSNGSLPDDQTLSVEIRLDKLEWLGL